MARYDAKRLFIIGFLLLSVLLLPFLYLTAGFIIEILDKLQDPVRNITSFYTTVLAFLLTILALPPVSLYILYFLSSESSEDSDSKRQKGGVVSRIIGLLSREKIAAVFVIIVLTQIYLLSAPTSTYDQYSGGVIDCHTPSQTHQNDVQNWKTVDFSNLNEIDKKVFRMEINDSYLKSVRDEVNEAAEYHLVGTEDKGNDEIIIYAGEIETGERRMIPPDGLSDEPMMDITGAEYFSGEFRYKPYVRYKNETYFCSLEKFRNPGV